MEITIPFPFLFIYLLLPTLILALSQSSSPICISNSGHVNPTTPLLNFLQTLQETAFLTFKNPKFDPKLYVDLSLKYKLSYSQKGFDKLVKYSNGSVSVKDLSEYIESYFEGAGEDLVGSKPEDFVSEPKGFLPKVKNGEVRSWALKIHSLWKNLSREVSDEVRKQPQLHTLIPLPKPVIIPGSRFREVYYWDSYWVIRGLVASKMYDTAKAIVNNLISLLQQYGHVLNGARTYYINRSQPPLLSAMVTEIYKRTGDLEFAKNSLPALIKEHKFWTSGIHKVSINDGDQAHNHTLTRYYAMWNKPRPESSTLDKELASNISSLTKKQKFYREVASTAESGWDFSTRWMRHHVDFTTLATTSILPVDLNAFILGMELDISFLANVTGDYTISKRFSKASRVRKKAIESVFWNEKTGQWHDYWLSNNSNCMINETWEARNQNQKVFASNFIPLWIESFHSDGVVVDKVMRSLQKSGLVHSAGIATSLTNSGQQWDFPNGLTRSGLKEARSMGREIAVSWLRTNYVTFKKTKTMHEKYNVEKCGFFGGGGEYVPQTGFGWSNGVVLALLEEFDSDPITIPTTPLVTFLERVQETALQTFGKSNFDPKLYVDLSLKTDLKVAEAGLNRVVETGSGLREYIEEYFEGAGEDLVYCEAEDYVAEPEGFLPKVKNEEVRKWALEIHSLWGNLSRKVSGEVWRRPERHTLLPLPELVMVPGSRFREVYYWDSYWVIRGLLASKMYETAKAIVNNLIFLIEEHGYVLNGARAYYTNRRDFPNGWAPIQHMIIEGLTRSGLKEARSMGREIAVSWLRTNYVTFKKTKTMHEKYNVEKCGFFGGGGEYVPQTGFGWSNGVVLALLEEFASYYFS
ncbi:hypothetical protein G4B88_006523 [Cannabis sativa]|uniref:Trehalase n=1 Tax=Cannabis sativa TaxID=3483 RepID=A0A7J6H2N4_CANSA|nr:hypothetical protein G4B88_006523 [Cannabis sativa]